MTTIKSLRLKVDGEWHNYDDNEYEITQQLDRYYIKPRNPKQGEPTAILYYDNRIQEKDMTTSCMVNGDTHEHVKIYH